MRRSLKSVSMGRLVLLGVVAGLTLLVRGSASEIGSKALSEAQGAEGALVEPVDPSALQAQPRAATPRYYYGSGYQGFGYYPAPVQQVAPAPVAAPRQAPSVRSTVGPGVRNWSTGRSSPLHRPWMKPM